MKAFLQGFQHTIFILFLNGIILHAQPTVITEVPKASTNFFKAGNLVYFTSHDSLFRTDGTAEGTAYIKNGLPDVGTMIEFRGMLFFTHDPGTPYNQSKELWRSDGTPSGTVLLKTSTTYDLVILTQTDTHLFFQASDNAYGRELFKTDGTIPGTQLVKDVYPGTANGYVDRATTVGSIVFFAGNDGAHGIELWKTDGTAAGTIMIKDINPGAADGFVLPPGSGSYIVPGGAFAHDDLFYFTGRTTAEGEEPWVSDGTDDGTILLQDIVAGSASPGDIFYRVGHEDIVYFIVYPNSSYVETVDLWKTGGTPLTTRLVKAIPDESWHFRVYHNDVYFFVWLNGVISQLFRTDGTPDGTEYIFEEYTHEGGIQFFDVVNDHLLFFGNHQNYVGCFFRSDGTTAGTKKFTCFNSSGYNSRPRDVTIVTDLVFYGDHAGPAEEGFPFNPDDYYHLFQTDGFVTQSMREMFGISTLGTTDIVNFNGRVLFTTRNDHLRADGPKQMWIYDPEQVTNELAGRVSSEVWTGVTGHDVSAIPVDSPPSSVSSLILFETPQNAGDSYGSRLRGYLVAPHTGDYTFWISSDDSGELWLSTDQNPINKTRIAEVPGWTNPHQWDKYPAQRSAPVILVRGQRYYIEALVKEAFGRDHLAVGWQLPDGSLETPIPASRVIPFEPPRMPDPCYQTGLIRQEFWTNVMGRRVSAIPSSRPPDFSQDLTMFEGPAFSVGDNYGSRIRGYICPPLTGAYTFWVAGDDNTELWLGSDDNADTKTNIAYHTGWTTRRDWTKYPTQQSPPVVLIANRRYYIEAVTKEGTGADHVSVGWQLPDGTLERPIAGMHLMPFPRVETMAVGESVTASATEESYSRISIYPNPALSSDAQLTVSGYDGISEPLETQIQIINMTGEVVFSDEIICGGNCREYFITMNKQLVPGIYVVQMQTDGVRSSRRLLVK